MSRGRADLGSTPVLIGSAVGLAILAAVSVSASAPALVVAVAGLVIPTLVVASDPEGVRSPLLLVIVSYLLGTVLHLTFWLITVQELPSDVLGFASETQLLWASVTIVAWLAVVSVTYLAFRGERRGHHLRSASRVPHSDRLRPGYVLWVAASIVAAIAGAVLVLRASGVLSLSDFLARPIAKRRSVVDTGAGTSQLSSVGATRSLALAAGPFASVLFVVGRRNKVGRPPGWLYSVLCLASVTVTVSLVLGGRAEGAAVLLVLVLLFTWTEERLRVSKVTLAVVLVIVFVVAAGVWRSSGNQQRENASLSADDVVAEFVAGSGQTNVSVLAAVLAAVPERVDYQNGATYTSLVFAPIPRTLWPEKPTVRAGSTFGERIFGLGSQRVTGRPPGMVGEAYLNFGASGIAISAVAYGFALGFAGRLVARRRSLNAIQLVIVAYLVIALTLRLPGGDFVGVFVSTVRSAVIAAFAYRVLVVVGATGSLESERKDDAGSLAST